VSSLILYILFGDLGVGTQGLTLAR
jgi:hypothetical protein